MKKEAVLSSETIFEQVGGSTEFLSHEPSAPELGVYAVEGNWSVRDFELRAPRLGAARHCCQGGCCWRTQLVRWRGCWGAASVMDSCSVLDFRLGKILICYPMGGRGGRGCTKCVSLRISINAVWVARPRGTPNHRNLWNFQSPTPCWTHNHRNRVELPVTYTPGTSSHRHHVEFPVTDPCGTHNHRNLVELSSHWRHVELPFTDNV